MKRIVIYGGLFILLVSIMGAIILSSENARSQELTDNERTQRGELCHISANYEEALDENHGVLLKLLSLIHSANSPLATNENLSLYSSTLSSMRRYHESMTPRLPECAQRTNADTLALIGATQDVLTFRMAQNLNPENSRLSSQISLSLANLDARWTQLSETLAITPLSIAPEGSGTNLP